MAQMSRVRPLVGVTWLRDSITANKPSLRVLETSFAAPGKGRESYLQKHIPTASFFDLWRCCRPTQFESKPVHEPQCFQDYARSLGLGGDDHLVIYDKGSLFFAARLWFTFKHFGHPSVSVLNGGFPSWQNMGYPIEDGEDEEEYESGDFTSRVSCSRYVNFSDISTLRNKSGHQIVDVRNFGHYKGEEKEPSKNTISALEAAGFPVPDSMQAGHIPGAKHVRKELFMHPETSEVHRAPEIKDAFSRQGIDLSRPITSLCYNGVSACLIPLAAAEAGVEDVSVYVGSWTEYGQKANDSEVETGVGHSHKSLDVQRRPADGA